MKKSLLLVAFFTVCALFICINVNVVTAADSTMSLKNLVISLNSIEALAAKETVCLGDPKVNTGHCSKAANGSGDVCVSGGTKTCYTHK